MSLLYQFLLFTVFSSAVNHEYHVGVYDIEIENNKLQITQKLFADDFQKAFIKEGLDVKFGDDINEPELSNAIQAYVKKHFQISVKKKNIELIFVGAEIEDFHDIFLYWESNNIKGGTSEIEIFNDIFLEISEEQQNMHHIKYEGKNLSLLLDKERNTGRIILE